MKGWGWDDAGVNDGNQSVPLDSPLRDPVAKGYSWDGTHDVGWANYVGFEVPGTTSNPTAFKARANNNTGDTGSTVVLQYTVKEAGTYYLDFGVGVSVGVAGGNQQYFGIYSLADGQWLGDATYNPESGTATSSAITIAFSDTAAPGDKYLIAWQNKALTDGDYAQVTFSHGTISLVPEPASLIMLSAGLLGLLAYAWRKRR